MCLLLVLLCSILFIYFLKSLTCWWHTCPLFILMASLMQHLFALSPFLAHHCTVLRSVLLLSWYVSNLPKISIFLHLFPSPQSDLTLYLFSWARLLRIFSSPSLALSSFLPWFFLLANIVRLRARDGTRHASSRLTQCSLLPTTICWSSGPHCPAQRAGRGAWKRQSLPESAQNWISGYRYTHACVLYKVLLFYSILISCTTSFLWLSEPAVEYKYTCNEVMIFVFVFCIWVFFYILLPSAVRDVCPLCAFWLHMWECNTSTWSGISMRYFQDWSVFHFPHIAANTLQNITLDKSVN